MSKSVQLRRGTSDEHLAFVGLAGEITVDTTLNTLRVHDGALAGGHALATATNSSFTGITTARQLNFANTFTAKASFPSASTYPGMVGYNQADNRLYYSNGTDFIKLVQNDDLTGFITNAANLGTAGDATLFNGISGSNLQFRTLRAGNNMALQVDQATQAVIINGPVYTFSNASDSGGATGIYSSVSNNAVSLRSLRAGSGITLNNTANEVSISATVTTNFKNITVGGSTAFSSTTANDTLNFAAAGGLTVTNPTSGTVTFGTSFSVTNSSSQTGSGVLNSYSSGTFVFNKIQAGSGILLNTGPNGEIQIANQYNGTVTGAANLSPPSPTSLGLYKQTDTGVLKFYNITAGTNVSISYDGPGNNLIISAAVGGGAGVGTVQTGTASYLAYYPSTGTAVGPIGSLAYWDSGTSTIHANITGTVSSLSNQTTSNLSEGTNLYYTQNRFDTALAAKTTTNLAEGTNQYFTTSRAQTAASTMMLAGNPVLTSNTTTASANSTSTATLTFANTSGVTTGMTVTASGVPNGVTVQSTTASTVIISPAAFVATGTSIVFANQSTSVTLTTTAAVTSTATLTVVSATGIATTQQISGTGITGRSVVTNVVGNTITLQPGYNVNVTSGGGVTFTAVPTTGLYSTSGSGTYTYTNEPSYVQNLARSAVGVVAGQGLVYDSNSGLFGLSGAVTSVNGYTGSVILRVADIPGAAPTASPTFTGTPLVPTPAGGTTSQIANVAYVNSQILGVTGTPPNGLTTLAAIASAINNDVNFNQTITSSIATKLSASGGAMSGVLILTGDPTSLSDPKTAATKNYVDIKATVQTVNTKSGNVVLYSDDITERSSPAPVNVYFTNTRARNAISLAIDNTIGSTTLLSYSTNDGVIRYNPNTDAIAEGSTNQYFTTSRARGSLSLQTGSSGALLQYNSGSGVFTYNASSDTLSEGTTNLFFTNTRARGAVTLSTSTGQVGFLTYTGSTGQFVINPNTDWVTEGLTNKFYLDSRARAAISLTLTSTANLNFASYSAGVITVNANSDNITEGTSNQFYTPTRVRNAVTLTSDNTNLLSYAPLTGQFVFNTPKTNNVTEGSGVLYLQASGQVSPNRIFASQQAVLATATVKAVLTATGVATILITNYGTGYTSAPSVVIGGGITGVTISNKGLGYSSAPTVTFPAPTGNVNGVTATGYAIIDTIGRVTGIVVTSPGSGYIGTPSITFTGSASTTAVATAVVAAGTGATATTALGTITGQTTQVITVAVTGAGSGFTDAPVVTFYGGGGSGATAQAYLTGTTLQSSAVVTSAGHGYQSAPSVVVSGGGGSGAVGTATVTNGVVTQINITAGGTGYTGTPTVTITGGAGFNGTVLVSSGAIVGVDITAGGSGYSATSAVSFSGTGTGALGFAVVTNTVTAASFGSVGSGFTSAPSVYLIGGGQYQSQRVNYDKTLGSVVYTDTNQSIEGYNNQYFTNARARNAVSVLVSNISNTGTTALTYNSSTGLLLLNANTDSINEGGTNKYYLDSRARAAVSSSSTSTSWTLSATQVASGTSGTNQFTVVSNTGINNGQYVKVQATGVSAILPGTTVTNVNGTTITISSNLQIALTSATVLFYTSTTSTNPTVSYSSSTGAISVNPNTDVLTEGNYNLFYTDTRARAAISLGTATQGSAAPLAYSALTGSLQFTLSFDSTNFTVDYTQAPNVTLKQNITTTSLVRFQGLRINSAYNGSSGALVSPTITLDLSTGNYFFATITAATAITVTNPPGAGICPQFKLVLANASATQWVLTFPANMKVKGRATGSASYAYSVSSTALPNATTSTVVYDVMEFTTFDGGTTYIQTSLLQQAN